VIVIATAHDANYTDLAAITLPSVRRYAERHGYQLYYENDIDPIEKDACKARIFLALYATGKYSADDTFMWIDTDALVMNSFVSISQLLQFETYFEPPHFLWGCDYNGPNSGVWFGRFTSHAAHYVKVYSLTARAMGWGDQEAMVQKMLVPPFNEWVWCKSGKLFNAYPYDAHGIDDWAHKYEVNAYEPGDFILHAAGIEEPRRSELLRYYASIAT
jgi:hypothetical protein